MSESSRIDKSALSVTTFAEQDARDREYWLSKTPEERFAAIEVIRQNLYGYDPATERLQRVLEITERP